MQRFLKQESDIALRVLTTARAPTQARFCEFFQNLIADEIDPEHLPLDLDDLAYLVVRIGESFCYIDLIYGGRPDPRKAGQAIAALLS